MIPKFAVIGCGAIAETYFLPVMTKRPDLCSGIWLVDPHQPRLTEMATMFNIPDVATSLDMVIDKIDAGIIATPHDLHFRFGKQLIEAGKHVFCEKPLTSLVADAETLVSMAESANLVLMTNNWRRDSAVYREVKRIIDSKQLGRPLSCEWVEGWKFNWPTKSGFYFTQKARDGVSPPGVMLDIGSHVIDLLSGWFGQLSHGGSPCVVACQTDSFGGPEARATLKVNFGDILTKTDLSYYQKSKNTFTIVFENGYVTGSCSDPTLTEVMLGQKPRQFIGQSMDFPRFATDLLTSFVNAITKGVPPMVSGRDVLPSIRAISDGYRCARPYDAPWLPKEIAL